MRKLILLFIITTTVLSCNKDVSGNYLSNKNDFRDLMELIQKNNEYFFNEVEKPRSFFTYNFKKEYKEFANLKNENTFIKESDFLRFQEIFTNLKINEFYFIDSNNIIFKIDEDDYFLKANNYFIGYIKDSSNFKSNNQLDGLLINEYKLIEKDWYTIIFNSSPAN